MTAETSVANSGERKGPPTLWAMALWNRPAAEGMASSAATEPAPADPPKIVT